MPEIRYIAVDRRPRNPFLQVVAFIVGLFALGTAAVLGAFLLAALLGALVIGAVIFYARLWWLRRQMPASAAGDEIIETEYTVISSTTRDGRKP